MRRKIVICGGHLTPALAVADLLKKEDWEIIFIGRKFALEGESGLSVEYKTTRERGLPFISLMTGRLQRSLTRFTFFSLVKVPVGFFQSLYWLIKLKPDVILSFGGYVALPVAMAGWILGIPIITHEQSVVPGLANKIISLFAKKVCVSWIKTMEMQKLVQYDDRKSKYVLTGNPIRKEIFEAVKHQDLRLHLEGVGINLNEDLPMIYITGGSLGSHAINRAVLEILPKLLEKYQIIHQCGESKYQDYEKLAQVSEKFTARQKERYFLFKYLDAVTVGQVLSLADLVISRSGANTVSELAVLGKPAILIPLPWAGQNEQVENAKLLESIGAAIILEQKNLTAESLSQCIKSLIQNLEQYKKKANQAKKLVNLQAGENLVKVIEETVSSASS